MYFTQELDRYKQINEMYNVFKKVGLMDYWDEKTCVIGLVVLKYLRFQKNRLYGMYRAIFMYFTEELHRYKQINEMYKDFQKVGLMGYWDEKSWVIGLFGLKYLGLQKNRLYGMYRAIFMYFTQELHRYKRINER